MSVLMISYDPCTDPNQHSVRQVIKQYRYIQLSESSYAIETEEKTRTVFNKIIPLFEFDVHLLVVTLIKPFASLPKGLVNKWLSKRLPED